MNNIILTPSPQTIIWQSGNYKVSETLSVLLPSEFKSLKPLLPMLLRGPVVCTDENANIRFIQNTTLSGEAYELNVNGQGITISGEIQGAFYALVTLGQIRVQSGSSFPFCQIKDEPSLKIRGLMIDISRGKVPKLKTLYELIDMLSLFKLNQLQLYIEGFSFAYPSFPEFWADKTPLTGEELQKLDSYCKERFIDLVPNQNCLGHMAAWLSTPRFRHLAELEEGLSVLGMNFPPTTLNPLDPESVKLIENMSSDLLINFTSSFFNFNMDEPFELGKGKSAKEVKIHGVGRIYIDYTKKMHKIAVSHGKQMMMWGDIISKHFDLADELPKDIIILDWGYEAEHPFEKRARVLQQSGLQFCLCPGTSSWNTITGLTDNMLENIKKAAHAAHTYGAKGILLTDWGDGGHLQYVPVSYAPILYSAALSWNSTEITNLNEERLAISLDRFVFMDKAECMGKLSLDAGRYYKFEAFGLACRTLATLPLMLGYRPREQYNMTIGMLLAAFSSMMTPEVADVYYEKYEDRADTDFEALKNYLKELYGVLLNQQMQCPHATQIAAEYKNALKMVYTLVDIIYFINNEENLSAAQINDEISNINKSIIEIQENHRNLWLYRNKSGGLEDGLKSFENLKTQLSSLKYDRRN